MKQRKEMYTAIKGVYEDGVLTLLEPAPNLSKSEVLITFLSEPKADTLKNRVPGSLLRLGELEGKKYDIPDDFNEPLDDFKEYM